MTNAILIVLLCLNALGLLALIVVVISSLSALHGIGREIQNDIWSIKKQAVGMRESCDRLRSKMETAIGIMRRLPSVTQRPVSLPTDGAEPAKV